MKECFKCHKTLPLSQFYRHRMMADGHLNKCKECAKVDVRTNRRAKIDYYRQYDIQRFRDDPERRAAQYQAASELRDKYPERMRARTAVGNAVRDGRLERKPCEVCGAIRVEAHHEDYGKPLEVRWLCRKHHNEAHHPMEQTA